ncbi:acetate/propionate family kinase [Leucobacter ruminantium]|uniref:Acetate kinase n=1 Tax=Leucobacter ruminantium TaxID=1289170 RepID=A0A939LY80_9MICO|nr:acetate kinase [Leucobacter ruminantium]MBO1805323.1 acetate kinase [Leucobacter ruminantium]
MSNVLVINAGSSSIKYQLVDAETGERSAAGLVERIGQRGSEGRIVHRSEGEGSAGARFERELPVPDHTAGFSAMVEAFAACGTPVEGLDIRAVGHRVVQGGSEFFEPTLIDDRVADRILELGALAPLHNPGQYQAIMAARARFDVPHVAVFDTAFHQTIPQRAYTYAIDRDVADRHGVRRYGFHGVSHQVVSRRAAAFLGRPIESLRQIVLHLGNGASACAIDGGRSVDTSMGFTPLEGLVMGTRGGDVDPGALLHLLRAGLETDELDALLNRGSGLAGLAGSNDFRDVWAAAEAGDGAARLALDVYAHRARHYIGAYLAVLGGADALVFTAGVGENHAGIRARICGGLEWLGVEIDPSRNEAAAAGPRRIGTDASRVEVLVVPTDEEAEIARQSWRLVAG